MRPFLAACLCLGFMPLAAHALPASEKGDEKKIDRCVDACIATQRSCVGKAGTLADKATCSKDNASCTTKCPLPNGGTKKS